MPIRRFSGYDTTPGYGGLSVLPKGGYVVRIKDAIIKTNRNGQYLEIPFDIAEGEYTGYFTDDYNRQTSSYRKWRGTYLLNVPNDDGTEQDGWAKTRFKNFTLALEASNPGYRFDWDETHFKGLIFGGLFNEREYMKSDDSIGRMINLAQVVPAERIRSGQYTIPADKILKKKAPAPKVIKEAEDEFSTLPDLGEPLPF